MATARPSAAARADGGGARISMCVARGLRACERAEIQGLCEVMEGPSQARVSGSLENGATRALARPCVMVCVSTFVFSSTSLSPSSDLSLHRPQAQPSLFRITHTRARAPLPPPTPPGREESARHQLGSGAPHTHTLEVSQPALSPFLFSPPLSFPRVLHLLLHRHQHHRLLHAPEFFICVI